MVRINSDVCRETAIFKGVTRSGGKWRRERDSNPRYRFPSILA
jgi:hypothetical protein